jgi:hypothetical protein
MFSFSEVDEAVSEGQGFISITRIEVKFLFILWTSGRCGRGLQVDKSFF